MADFRMVPLDREEEPKKVEPPEEGGVPQVDRRKVDNRRVFFNVEKISLEDDDFTEKALQAKNESPESEMATADIEKGLRANIPGFDYGYPIDKEHWVFGTARPKFKDDDVKRFYSDGTRVPGPVGRREDPSKKPGYKPPSAPEGFLDSAFTVLGYDEHWLVHKIAKYGFGINEYGDDFKDMSNYTYTMLLKHPKAFGLPDNGWVSTLGFVASVFLSPVNWLTLGGSSGLKITGKVGKGVKGLAKVKGGSKELVRQGVDITAPLTKRGEKIINQLERERVGKLTQNFIAKSKKKLTEKEVLAFSAKVRPKVREQLHNEVVRKYARIYSDIKKVDDLKHLKVSKAVDALPNTIFDRGSIKVGVPVFSAFGGKIPLVTREAQFGSLPGVRKLLDGTAIAVRAKKYDLPELLQAMSQRGNALRGNLRKAELARRAAQEDPTLANKANLKVWQVREFFRGWKHMGNVERDFLKTAEEINFKARTRQMQVEKRVNQWLETAGIKTVTQRKEFGKAMKAATQLEYIPDDKYLVDILGVKDKAVRNLINRYIQAAEGTGKMAAPKKIVNGKWVKDKSGKVRRSMMQTIGAQSKRVADRVGGMTFEELSNPVWWPGVHKHAGKMPKIMPTPLELQRGIVDVGFLKSRQVDKSRTWTTDPIQALTHRRMALFAANLHLDTFDAMKKQGKVKFMTKREKGWTLVRPPDWVDSITDGPKNKYKNTQKGGWYMRSEDLKQYKTLVGDQEFRQPGLYRNLLNHWKYSVTVPWPAFTIRNGLTNVVHNSYNMGGAAINPDKLAEGVELLTGSNLKKKIVFDNGDVMTREAFLKEARGMNVVSSGWIGGDVITEDNMAKYIVEQYKDIAKMFRDGAMGFAEGDFLGFAASIGKGSAKGAGRLLRDAAGIGTFWIDKGSLPAAGMVKFARGVEEHARIINYLEFRRRGYTPIAAKAKVNEVLFDYNAITGFDAKAKMIMPFYTFRRKNFEMNLKMLATKPAKIKAHMAFLREHGPTQEEWEQMPEWVRTNTVLRVLGYLSVGYGSTLYDFLSILQDAGSLASKAIPGPDMEGSNTIVSGMSPILKTAAEMTSFDHDTRMAYFNKYAKLEEYRMVYELAEDEEAPQGVREFARTISDFLEFSEHPSRDGETVIRANGWKVHLLKNMFTSRFQSSLGQLSKKEVETLPKVLRFTMGVYPADLDAESVAYFEHRKWKGMINVFLREKYQARDAQRSWVPLTDDKPSQRNLNEIIKKFDEIDKTDINLVREAGQQAMDQIIDLMEGQASIQKPPKSKLYEAIEAAGRALHDDEPEQPLIRLKKKDRDKVERGLPRENVRRPVPGGSDKIRKMLEERERLNRLLEGGE